MASTEVTALIRERASQWVAAIAFVEVGEVTLDATTTDSEMTARHWIYEAAAQRGFAEQDIRFK